MTVTGVLFSERQLSKESSKTDKALGIDKN